MKFDELDRQIVRNLHTDGRMSNVEIARRIGVSESAVRKRIDHLIQNELIKVRAVVNAAHLGYQTAALVAISVEMGRIEEVAQALMNMPEVRYVAIVTGAQDILIEAVFTSNQALLVFLENRLGQVPGIRSTDTMIVPKVLKTQAEWEPPAALSVDVVGSAPRS